MALSSSIIGCNIAGLFMNHFSYADDMSMLAPSADGLQKLLSICTDYAKKYGTVFNSLKSVCMCIKPLKYKLARIPIIYLAGAAMQYVNNFKYLGYVITDNLVDVQDMQRQLRSIYVKCNMLIYRFNSCTPEVKVQLFQSYCSNFYCSHLWNCYTQAILNKVKIAFNKGFRHFLGYPRDFSASQMFLDNGVHHFDVLQRKVYMHI